MKILADYELSGVHWHMLLDEYVVRNKVDSFQICLETPSEIAQCASRFLRWSCIHMLCSDGRGGLLHGEEVR